jgi:phenylpropionate dioxygenase-like ring-hydroxylating dioxygenase large terminal subunit
MDNERINLYVDDRPSEGVFRVHRDVFSDPALFELEMKHIFERTWIFLGLESQVARPNDYFTSTIGRTPVLVTRTPQGALGAFVNACRHKGATVARLESGTAKFHVCPYHGWAYDAAGRNVDIKDRAAGAYAPAFEHENHDLLPIARVESYRGLIFGSLSGEVPPLPEFLGELRFFIDCAMDQSAHGMEFIPGRSVYTFRGNWKLQMDNGVDPYHLTTTHVSFIDVQRRRRKGQGNVVARQFDWDARAQIGGGIYNFEHGHSALWRYHPGEEAAKRPIYPVIDEIAERVGQQRADWMLKPRTVIVFPNMQIADTVALMLRTFHPISVDRTEMRSWCLAPIGEKPELRAQRLRQFEDFFNPAGLATPDDTVVYEDCQRGFLAEGLSWLQGYSRALGAVHDGGDAVAGEIGVKPVRSTPGPIEMCPETGLHSPYREWARLLEAGVSGHKPY